MSQLEGHSENINGIQYTVYMLPPKTARKYINKIMLLGGPLMGGMAAGGMDSKIDFGEIGKFIKDNLPESDIDALIDIMAEHSEADGVRLHRIYDNHFRGRMGDHYLWFFYALKVNFQDFFSVIKDAFAAQTQGEEVASVSPITSTG